MVRGGVALLAFDGALRLETAGVSLVFLSAFGALEAQDAPRARLLSMTCGETTQPRSQHPDAGAPAANPYAVQSSVTVLERP